MTDEEDEKEVKEEAERSKVKPKKPGPGQGVKGHVKTFFYRHPNVNVFTTQLMKAVGVTDVRPIQHAIHQLRSSGEPIAIVERGHVYMYVPERDRGGGLPFDVPLEGGSSSRKSLTAVGEVVQFPLNDILPAKRTFTEVGPTKDGWYVIQADDGALFKAEPL